MEARKEVWDQFIQKMQEHGITENEIKRKTLSEIKGLLESTDLNGTQFHSFINSFKLSHWDTG